MYKKWNGEKNIRKKSFTSIENTYKATLMLYDKIRLYLYDILFYLFRRTSYILQIQKGKFMNSKRKEKISEHLRTIANREGISEKEVRNEIAYAVSLALKSNDPKIQSFWKQIPCEGESPTIEEIIDFIITQISAQG